MKRDRVSLSVFVAMMGLVIGIVMGMGGTAWAALVSVEGTFTSFVSDIHDPAVRRYYVNGTQLTSSGTPGSTGSPYYRSNVVDFSAPTTAVTFTYDPTIVLWDGSHFLSNSVEFISSGPMDVTRNGNTGTSNIFELGILRVTNGQYSPSTDIGITLTTRSTDPLLKDQTFSGTIRYLSISTDPIGYANGGTGAAIYDPVAEADHFYFLPGSGMEITGDARVYDLVAQPAGNPGNVAEFAIYGYIGSLHLSSLVALSGGGFTTSSTGITVVDPVFPGSAPVPEPGTMMLLGSGLAGLVGFGRKRLKK